MRTPLTALTPNPSPSGEGGKKGRRNSPSGAALTPNPSPSGEGRKAGRTTHKPAHAPGQVRIIGGEWRRRLLPVASGPGVPEGLRPTPDRVRETLFNWLGQDLSSWSCLDLCAGTGALGLEAASRGASHVVLVENNAALVRQLQQLVQQLEASQVQVRQSDALSVLREYGSGQRQVDVVLLDPPYDANWYAAALKAAVAAVCADGYLYLEAGRQWTEEELAELGWRCVRHLKAGQVHAHLLQPIKE